MLCICARAQLIWPPGAMLNRKLYFGIWWRRAIRFRWGMSDWRRCYLGRGVPRRVVERVEWRRKSWEVSFCGVILVGGEWVGAGNGWMEKVMCVQDGILMC